jgi:hypothetical protein
LRQLCLLLPSYAPHISIIYLCPSPLYSTERGSNGKAKTPGRIIVHDRNRVQSQVLPLYFNHASFASLRRQLSYFSFVRVGKGRQAGSVTYVNDAVVELSDILRLKRRAVGDSSPSGASTKVQAVDEKKKQAQHQQQKVPAKGEKKQQTSDQPSRDVSSAVLSGRMHACETNHDLDANKYHQSLSVGTSKSTLAITLGTKSRAAVKKSSKASGKKKRSSSKYKRSRKGGARVDRLLYVNYIVPFIHLPVRLFKAKCLQESMLKEASQAEPSSTSEGGKKSRNEGKPSGTTSGSNSSEDNGFEAGGNKKARAGGRGETTTASSLTEPFFQAAQQGNAADRNTSESVVSALLALGAGHHY